MANEPKAFISPRFPPEKLESGNFDDLVDVLEDRVRGWLLEPAKKLIADPIDQVAGVALSLSYYEGITIFMRGVDSKNKSKRFFRDGFVEVFKSSGTAESTLGRVADVFYEDGRCGFFHDAMFRTRVYFSAIVGNPLAITLPEVAGRIDESGEIEAIVVHAPEYFKYVEGHFKKYLAQLRDPSQAQLRQNFESACSLKWDLGGPPRVIAL